MHTKKRLDARKDQLKILKLERRHMRGLATTLLDNKVSKKSKQLAITGAVAALLALQGAPEEYFNRLGIASSSDMIERACAACDNIAVRVDANVGRSAMINDLAGLFSIVDEEHARLELLAKDANARLLQVEDQAIGDGGGNKTLVSWLNGGSKVIGDGGGNKSLASWLNAENKVIGDGGGNKTLVSWLIQFTTSAR